MGGVYLMLENNYRFGRGNLWVKVLRLYEPVNTAGPGKTADWWWYVHAVVRSTTETARPGYERDIYLRASVLRTARRSEAPREGSQPEP
ncbi:hypothetical protein J2S43_003721 [Catenuloplanes nepalensis]|uniref:Uncharacterized protein n=1 Tax=Catenuloplanes nepalensis TaxID=587533 RepID=A0ABT9MUT8_9ACTN|nr:hypothetical protein [Catenuloplanes nepalensis]